MDWKDIILQTHTSRRTTYLLKLKSEFWNFRLIILNGNLFLYFSENNESLIDTKDLLSPNKLERLATECSQTDMLRLPCRPNQKWYCHNDNGRWRKHKCKSAPSPIFGSFSNKSFRKCACFTAAGLVYKKIPVIPDH